MNTADGNEARTAWRSAEDLSALCALGERFLRGELDRFPGWGSPTVDAETDHLLPHLIAFNRAGWFTLASQPGTRNVRSHDGAVEHQRAFVAGFASASVAARLSALVDTPELHVASFAPGIRGGERIPVTVCDSETRVFAGHCAVDAELECMRELCSARALDALARAHYVTAIDLHWDRDTSLWSRLAAALSGSTSQSASVP